MRSVIPAAVVLLLAAVELAHGRPQTGPLSALPPPEGTTASPETVSKPTTTTTTTTTTRTTTRPTPGPTPGPTPSPTPGPTPGPTPDTDECYCPDGKYPCDQCARSKAPRFFVFKPYNGDCKPSYFAYLDKHGTYQTQTIFQTCKGPQYFGSFGYVEKCSGVRVDQTYEAGPNGYQPGVVYITDGSPDVQLPEFDLTLVPAEEQAAGRESL